jgi:hypothetical protein
MDVMKYSAFRVIPKVLDNLMGEGKIAQLQKQNEESEAELSKMKATQAEQKQPAEMKKGGKVSSASKRADGIAIRGKTRA